MEIRPHTPPSTREPDPVSRTCQRGDKDLGYVFSNLPSSAAEEGLGVGAFDVGSAVEELALADPAAVAEPGSDPPSGDCIPQPTLGSGQGVTGAIGNALLAVKRGRLER